MMEDKKYVKAKKKVKEIKDFYMHLIIFLVVIVILTIINLITLATGQADNEGWNFWFLFPFGFWGFAVLMHGMNVFVFGKNTRWEQQKIKEIMKQMDKEN